MANWEVVAAQIHFIAYQKGLNDLINLYLVPNNFHKRKVSSYSFPISMSIIGHS